MTTRPTSRWPSTGSSRSPAPPPRPSPAWGPVALWHRTGLVALGAASVNVTVAAGHRGTAFDAARFCIDVLKATVPVWKIEHDGTGSHRADAGTAVPVSVAAAARSWLANHHGSDPGCRECA